MILSPTPTPPKLTEEIKHHHAVLNVILGTACLLLMVQLYLIAPLIPGLVNQFNSALMELAIPVFAISFALSALITAFFPSFIQNANSLFSVSLLMMSLGAILLSNVESAEGFLLNRALTGLGTGFMLPSALLIATRSAERTGSFRAMIIIVFFLATGMTFGPSTGGWLNGTLGWQHLYLTIGAVTALVWLLHLFYCKTRYGLAHTIRLVKAHTVTQIIWKSRAAYLFTFLSGVFHSGVFVWICFYFTAQFKLSEYELANALIIFGVPGLVTTIIMFIFGWDAKVIRILYSGLIITMGGLFIMLLNIPLWLAESLLPIMSIGYCFSQPLFMGIIKLPLGGIFAGRLIAIGSAVLFAGYGIGPLIMAALLNTNKAVPIVVLIVLVVILASLSHQVWHITQVHKRHKTIQGNISIQNR